LKRRHCGVKEGSKSLEKEKISFPNRESKKEFSISQPYPSGYIDCFIPGYSMSIKRVKNEGKM